MVVLCDVLMVRRPSPRSSPPSVRIPTFRLADFAVEVNHSEFGAPELPGSAVHRIDRVGAADTISDHGQAAGFGHVRVQVYASHEAVGKDVVFEDDDVQAGFSGTEVVLVERVLVMGVERE